MVKLITLYSNDGKLNFKNNIQANLQLEPYSKMALYNASFEKDLNALIITQENQEVILTIDRVGLGTNTFSVLLNLGTYNDFNLHLLINQIQNELNAQLDFLVTDANEKNVGLICLTVENRSERLFEFGVFQNPMTDFYELSINNDERVRELVVVDNIYYTPTIGVNINGNPGYLRSDGNYIFNGCIELTTSTTQQKQKGGGWIYAIEIGSISATSTGGNVGLCFNVNSPLNDIETNYVLALEITNNTVNYFMISPDDPLSKVNTNVACAADDVIVFRLNNNLLELIVFSTAVPGGTPLYSKTHIDYEYEGYFPVLYMHPAVDALEQLLLSFVRTACNVDTFAVDDRLKKNQKIISKIPVKNLIPSEPVILANTKALIGNQYYGVVDYAITFDKDVSDFFGFVNQTIELPAHKNFDLIGDFPIQVYPNVDTFLVELLTYSIESYDSYINARSNILMLFNNDKPNTGSIVTYKTGHPIFIDMNNLNSIQLRSLQCRIIDRQYQTLRSRGGATITLAIKGPNEN